MPIYEYKCSSCGKVFEVLQKRFDVDEAPCESCGQPGKRIMSNTSFVLKGSGWYVTDYKANGGCSASGGNESCKSAGAATSGESASDTSGSADAKPAAPCPSSGCASCSGASSSASADS